MIQNRPPLAIRHPFWMLQSIEYGDLSTDRLRFYHSAKRLPLFVFEVNGLAEFTNPFFCFCFIRIFAWRIDPVIYVHIILHSLCKYQCCVRVLVLGLRYVDNKDLLIQVPTLQSEDWTLVSLGN